MNRRLPWLPLMTCVAATVGSALLAQPRVPAPKVPRVESRVTATEMANPCGRALCYTSARSHAIALAWVNGLDEEGVPLDAGTRAGKLAEMENWLRRLAGTFRIEGTYRNHGGSSQVRGSAKCLGVGNGPGLSCMITATWKAPRESYKDPAFDKALYAAMQPLILVFGIDPDALQVRATVIDQRALKMSGFLVDGEVAFSGEPMSLDSLVPYTWDSSFVAIKPDDDVDIRFAVHPTDTRYMLEGLRVLRGQFSPNSWIEFDMHLHRDEQVDARPP